MPGSSVADRDISGRLTAFVPTYPRRGEGAVHRESSRLPSLFTGKEANWTATELT
jgi:hypothetical protein